MIFQILFLMLFFVSGVHGCAICGNISYVLTNTKLYVSKEKIEKLSINWMFDEQLSQQLIEWYDTNKNQKLEGSEVVLMLDTISKQEPKYFTALFIDTKSYPIESLDNFQVYTNDKNLFYSFDITLNKRLNEDTINILLYFDDASHTFSFMNKSKSTEVINTSYHKVKQEFQFKVIRSTMSSVNAIQFTLYK